MTNREKPIVAILSLLSEEALETDLPQQLYADLIAKTDEEFDLVCNNIAKAFVAKYSPLRRMPSHTDLNVSPYSFIKTTKEQ